MRSFYSFLRVNLKWVLLVGITVLVNMLIVLLTYRQGIDIGDGSTFFQFARNIANGEVFYRDFIHFRTPASYGLYASFITLLGDSYSSLRLGMLVETRVLYPIIFIIAFAVLFKRKYFYVLVTVVALLVLLPEYAQLRTVLALLATAVLARAIVTDRSSFNKTLIFVAGILGGVSFMFGQEAGVMAGAIAAIGVVLLSIRKKNGIKQALVTLLLYGSGFFIGMLPLLIYAIIHGQLFNFLYYSVYYAFILQPKYMDLPFPQFGYDSLVYYLPFVIVVLSVVSFFSIKNTTLRTTLGLFTAFVVLRLVTLVGRSDMGHLLFIVPELIALALLAYVIPLSEKIKTISITRNLIIGVLAIIATFLLIVTGGSSMLLMMTALVAASTLCLFFKDKILIKINTVHLVSGILAVLAVFLFLLLPDMLGKIKQIKAVATGTAQMQYSINGSYVSESTYELLSSVEEAVKKRNPETLFSYPIQPYFYSFAKDHATSFMTYEPQTTVGEQERTIRELKERRPEVILLDPIQASALSGSLGMINEYVMTHYKVTETIESSRIIWLLEPRQTPEVSVPFVLTALFNDSRNATAVQSPDRGINNGLIVNANTEMELNVKDVRLLKLTVVSENKCFYVSIVGSESRLVNVCQSINPQELSLDRMKAYRIVIKNTHDTPLVLKDVLIER